MRRSWLALVLVAVVVGFPVPAGAEGGERAAPAGPKVGKILDDRALTRSGKWRSKASSAAYLGTLTKSKDKGARLTTPEATTGNGAVSFQTGPGRGKADIIVGGVKKATVKTASKNKRTKVVQFTGAGTVVIKVKKPGKGVYVDVVALSNSGSGSSAPGVGEVIFTEWMSNPEAVSDTDGEWFELLNLTDKTFNLTGCTVINQSSLSSTLSASLMLAHNVFGFARSTDSSVNGGIIVDGSFGFGLPASGSLTLKCGTTTIDSVSWTSETSGKSTALDPDHSTAAENDVPANYCLGAVPYGDGDFGTPLQYNPQCV